MNIVDMKVPVWLHHKMVWTKEQRGEDRVKVGCMQSYIEARQVWVKGVERR